MAKWIEHQFNKIIYTAAQKNPLLRHWKDIQLDHSLMDEQMLYSQKSSRHADTNHLFRNPDFNQLQEGLVVLCHNFVNVKPENILKKPRIFFTEKSKHFCVCNDAKNSQKCYNGKHAETNEFFDNIRNGSVIAMGFLAAFITAHMVKSSFFYLITALRMDSSRYTINNCCCAG